METNIFFGDQGFERAIKKFEKDFIKRVKEIVFKTAYIIYSDAVANAPVAEVDGGALKNSITISSDLESKGFSCTVSVGSDYAVYVEYGTGIYAEEGNGRKDPWVYWSDKLGRYVFTRGMRPHHFWNPAVESGTQYWYKNMK
jgi:HK97 gp10 family phage protein